MENTKKVKVQVINAFVEDVLGGNPAGVVLDADNLSDKNKLEIAKQVGLSETAFVSESKVADFKLDFFTPNRQIAHCGHATIATFSYLKQIGRLNTLNATKETIDGNRKIRLVGDLAFMEQKAPRYTVITEMENEILASLNLKRTDLIPQATISLVNTGNSFVIIPLKSTENLKNIQPNFEQVTAISNQLDLIGFYPFTLEKFDGKSDAQTRMFGPRYDINEEAGTGMAAGPLAAYLYDIIRIKKPNFVIAQGRFMKEPSPSVIYVELEIHNGAIISLMAGGKGSVKDQKSINIG